MPVSLSERPVSNNLPSQNWDRVIRLCRSSLLLEGPKPELYALLGRAFVQKGQIDTAVAAYEKGLTLDLEQAESHRVLGILYSRKQKIVPAISHYRSALELRPDWFLVALALGQLLQQQRALQAAMNVYKTALSYSPDAGELYLAMGRLLHHKGEARQAIRHYRNAIFRHCPPPRVYPHLGQALVQVEAYAAAAALFRQALKHPPQKPEQEARLHSGLGQSLAMQSNTAGAIAAYQQALSLNPNLALAHQNLGRLHRKYQDHAAASHYFYQALGCQPDAPSIRQDYAYSLIAEGDWDGLIDHLRMSVSRQSGLIQAFQDTYRSEAQLSAPDLLDQLRHRCREFLTALQSSSVQARTGQAQLKQRLGQVYTCLGNLSVACDAPVPAEQFYRYAIALLPENPALYRHLGDCLAGQRRFAAAAVTYRAGLRRAAKRPASLNRLQRQLRWVLAARNADTAKSVEWHPRAQDWQIQTWRAHNGISSQDLVVSTEEWPAKETSNNEVLPSKQLPETCGGVTCSRCMKQLMPQFSPQQVGPKGFYCNPGHAGSSAVDDYPTFMVTLPEGRAWIAPQMNAWDVCNDIRIYAPDGKVIGDVSRRYPWYLPGCPVSQSRQQQLLTEPVDLPPVQRLAGRVAVLSGLSGHIYYHWMFDVLPRIEILQRVLREQGLDLADVDHFVVNNINRPFQKETLAALGIPLDKVIASDEVPYLQAEQLLVPSFAGYLDWVPMRTVSYLRRQFLPFQSAAAANNKAMGTAASAKNLRSGSKRYYISRHEARYRQVLNESEVMALLSTLGFVSVTLESLTVRQQAALFADADAIVTPHGSGLSNLVFCSPETKVVELFSPHYLRTDYWMISQYLNLHHYYLVGEGCTDAALRQLMYPSGLTEDFSVDLAALRSLLQTAGLSSVS